MQMTKARTNRQMYDDECANLISTVEESLAKPRASTFAIWTWGRWLAFITGIGGVLLSWRAFDALFGQKGGLSG